MRWIAALLVWVSAGVAYAQNPDSLKWNPDLDLNLTLTQNSYSDNWAGGDAGSLSWVVSSNSSAISPNRNRSTGAGTRAQAGRLRA